jgi:hypothetical protein
MIAAVDGMALLCPVLYLEDPFPGIKTQLKRWFKRAIPIMKSLLHLHSKD